MIEIYGEKTCWDIIEKEPEEITHFIEIENYNPYDLLRDLNYEDQYKEIDEEINWIQFRKRSIGQKRLEHTEEVYKIICRTC